MAVSFGMEYGAVNTQVGKLKDAMGQAASVVTQATGEKTKYEAQKAKANEEENAVRSIIAGQEERFNWLELERFVSDVLPHPDGTNIVNADAASRYFKNNQKAKKAYDLFKERERTGKISAEGDEEGIEDLALINLEGVDCRFTDDVGAYWTNLKARQDFATSIRSTILPESHKEI